MPAIPRGGGAAAPALSPAAMGVVPFTAAAHKHTEPFFDATFTPGVSAQQIGPIDVPAYGYLRNLIIQVDGSGGALGGGTISPDYPWNLFQVMQLSDVNGAPIYGPTDGYAHLWQNIAGGYSGGRLDLRTAPGFVGTINPLALFRIPVEISQRNGYGALANQNAAAAYKLSLTLNTLANIVTAGAPTAPAIRIRCFLEAWSLPNESDVLGRPQEQLPPMHGTTQYWSQTFKNISVGSQTTLLTRVGNLIRSLVIISRNAAGVRTANVMPDPAQIFWDARSMRQDTQAYMNFEFGNQLPDLTALDAGVFCYNFSNSDHGIAGDDAPTFWWPTVQASRIEIQGTSGTAGTLQICTNDIAPVEVIPVERFVETSRTGYSPQLGSAPARS